MRLGQAVALEQVLGRIGPSRHGIVGGVIAAAQLERVEVELSRQLVEQALQREGSLDETGSAERAHRREVQLRGLGHRPHVRARVEHLHRAFEHRGEPRTARRVDELAFERSQRAVGPGSRDDALDGRIAVPCRHVMLPPGERARDGPAGALRQLGRDEGVGRPRSSWSQKPPPMCSQTTRIRSEVRSRAPRQARPGRPRRSGSRCAPRASRRRSGRPRRAARVSCGSRSVSGRSPPRRRPPRRARVADVPACERADVQDQAALERFEARVELEPELLPHDADQGEGALRASRRGCRRRPRRRGRPRARSARRARCSLPAR